MRDLILACLGLLICAPLLWFAIASHRAERRWLEREEKRQEGQVDG